MKIEKLIPLAVILLTLATYPGIAKTSQELYTFWVGIEESEAGDLFLFQLFSPGAGEEVLPRPVQSVLSLLRQNHVSSYRHASSFDQQSKLLQRLIEGTYPIRNDPSSAFLVLLDSDALPDNCTVTDQREGVRLAYCP